VAQAGERKARPDGSVAMAATGLMPAAEASAFEKAVLDMWQAPTKHGISQALFAEKISALTKLVQESSALPDKRKRMTTILAAMDKNKKLGSAATIRKYLAIFLRDPLAWNDEQVVNLNKTHKLTAENLQEAEMAVAQLMDEGKVEVKVEAKEEAMEEAKEKIMVEAGREMTAKAQKRGGDEASAKDEPAAKRAKPESVAESAKGVINEDAPPESQAHKAVKWAIKSDGKDAKYTFTYMSPGGSRITMQVTLGRANNCAEDAARICRLVYRVLEMGGTQQEAAARRGELLERCKQTHAPVAPPVDAPLEVVVASGDGVITVDAPPESQAHQAVRLENRPNGAALYKCVWKSPDRSVQIPLQVTLAKANNCAADAARICRLSFRILETGGTKQQAEARKQELCDKCQGAQRALGDAVTEKPAKKAKLEKELNGRGPTKVTGSSSSASSSSTSDSEEAKPLAERGRVCAKVLVRAGIRCPCHFWPKRFCPNAASR